jgi:hypothetical protein
MSVGPFRGGQSPGPGPTDAVISDEEPVGMIFALIEVVTWDLVILLLGLLVPIALGLLVTRPRAGRPAK